MEPLRQLKRTLAGFRWFEWLHHAYVLLALISMAIAAFGVEHSDKEKIFIWLLGIYFVILLVAFIGTLFTYGRKARYADATANLHDSLHAARDAYHYLEWCLCPDRENVVFDKTRLRGILIQSLTAANAAFSLVNGVPCRTSLKLLGTTAVMPEDLNSLDKIYVQTLARDAVSAKKCEDRDRVEGKKHLISDNTDFQFILRRRINFFFSGDLSKEHNYENSSITDMSQGSTDGSTSWPLAYKSTIVWPIRYLYSLAEKDELGNNQLLSDQDLYGYLTVDSASRNAFDGRYDVQMGATLADALFPVLDAYRKVREQQKNGSKSPTPGATE